MNWKNIWINIGAALMGTFLVMCVQMVLDWWPGFITGMPFASGCFSAAFTAIAGGIIGIRQWGV